MKLFLALIFTSWSVGAFAQALNEPTLFPELSEFSSEQNKKNAEELEGKEEKLSMDDMNIENAEREYNLEENENLKEISQTDEEKTEEESEWENEEENDEKEQFIYLLVDDVKATLTPNRNASFCSAGFAVANGLKKEIKTISGDFTVGSMTKKFSFNGIGEGQATGAKYTFVGTSCEEILNTPAYTINKCEVEGWSEKKCKSKVKFVEIPKEEASL